MPRQRQLVPDGSSWIRAARDPKGAFRRKMTYEDKAPYASSSLYSYSYAYIRNVSICFLMLAFLRDWPKFSRR